MGSEQNDSTSFPPSESKLCDNGCGFFGSPSNMNLCSKCYRSLRAEEDQTAVAKAAVKKSLKQLPSCSLHTPEQPPLEPKQRASPEPVAVTTTTPSSIPLATDNNNNQGEPSRPKNRCFTCNKKVGIMGFNCKCGSTFCGNHRYPEKHECSFDFKEIGRDAIAKANPVVKADKVQRI